MSDVGGLGRIPTGIERVDRSNSSGDESRRQQKDKKKKQKTAPKPKAEREREEALEPGTESEEKETPGAVIDVLDEDGESRPDTIASGEPDDPDEEERGRHVDTRA